MIGNAFDADVCAHFHFYDMAIFAGRWIEKGFDLRHSRTLPLIHESEWRLVPNTPGLAVGNIRLILSEMG